MPDCRPTPGKLTFTGGICWVLLALAMVQSVVAQTWREKLQALAAQDLPVQVEERRFQRCPERGGPGGFARGRRSGSPGSG